MRAARADNTPQHNTAQQQPTAKQYPIIVFSDMHGKEY
jgi:hypothetical protein